MLIVDSQVHVWGANTPETPWVADAAPQRAVPLEPEELLREMDQAGVDRAVLVPPTWAGSSNVLALSAARMYPGRFAVMGRIHPARFEDARGTLATWRDQPGMLGLRFTFNRPMTEQVFVAGVLDWLWEDAEAAGIPVMLLVPHALLGTVDQIASRHPGLRIVLDHMALTIGETDSHAFRNIHKVFDLAKRDNVAVKLSALPCYSTDAYPYRNLHPYIRQACHAFGPKRLFWGTDFSRSPISYAHQVEMFTKEMPWLSMEDREWIMGRGVCEWLGWA